MSPAGTPLALKPAPETLTFETVTLELPGLVMVTVRGLLLPVFTPPKLKLDGVALRPEAAPVSAAGSEPVKARHPDRRNAANRSVSRPSKTPLRVAAALGRASPWREWEYMT